FILTLFITYSLYSFFSLPVFLLLLSLFFFLNAPATTEIYTLSLHDALPIFGFSNGRGVSPSLGIRGAGAPLRRGSPELSSIALLDRKSTRLNSSHLGISYAVFCLKKKKNKKKNNRNR